MSNPVSPGRQAEKRGATTPLAPSKCHNKKKFTQKTPQKQLIDASLPAVDYLKELLAAKYACWIKDKQLESQQEITDFLILEREMLMDST